MILDQRFNQLNGLQYKTNVKCLHGAYNKYYNIIEVTVQVPVHTVQNKCLESFMGRNNNKSLRIYQKANT